VAAPADGPRNVPPPSGESLLELIRVMDRLRSPGGCPWDAEQTHESLVSYLTEEAHEAVEAIETGDRAAVREELGDVLLQVMFHSRIAQEDPVDPWSIDDVAAGIVAKLVARHPHVFGDETADSAAHVESTWLARKTAEKSRESVLDGIPAGLPALLLAAKIRYRATHGGVRVPAADEPTGALAARALDEVGPERTGALLLALVSEALDRGVDPESALRGALRDHAAEIRAVETEIRAAEPAPGAAGDAGVAGG
jgi:XTP/dITP diphosphohydrolase